MSTDAQKYLRDALLNIAMRHAVLAEQVGQRFAVACRNGTKPTTADRGFMEHWLQVLTALAEVVCDQPQADLKALAARLDELASIVRLHLKD